MKLRSLDIQAKKSSIVKRGGNNVTEEVSNKVNTAAISSESQW